MIKKTIFFILIISLFFTLNIHISVALDQVHLENLTGNVIEPEIKIYSLDYKYRGSFVVSDAFTYEVKLINKKNNLIESNKFNVTLYDPDNLIVLSTIYDKNISDSIILVPKFFDQTSAPN